MILFSVLGSQPSLQEQLVTSHGYQNNVRDGDRDQIRRDTFSVCHDPRLVKADRKRPPRSRGKQIPVRPRAAACSHDESLVKLPRARRDPVAHYFDKNYRLKTVLLSVLGLKVVTVSALRTVVSSAHLRQLAGLAHHFLRATPATFHVVSCKAATL